MSRGDDQRVADILEVAAELALVVQVWQIAAVSVPELVRHLRPDGATGF